MGIEKNLFYHAKKELSLDAFLAYVFYNYEDNEHIINSLLNNFFNEKRNWVNEIKYIEVMKQYKKIDLIVEIEFLYGDKKIIVFENKVMQNLSKGQLKKYYQIILEDNYYNLRNVYFVFLKLGFPDPKDSNQIKEANKLQESDWMSYYINDFFNMFIHSSRDQIANQFAEYLRYIKSRERSSINDWDYYDFGFFLDEILKCVKAEDDEYELVLGKTKSVIFNHPKMGYYLEFKIEKNKNRIELVKNSNNGIKYNQNDYSYIDKRPSSSKPRKGAKKYYLARRKIDTNDSIDMVKKILLNSINEYKAVIKRNSY